MNVNKKLDRLKQWAGERMGGEVKTTTSDEFKALETEMTLRHEGMEKLHKSMNIYVKSLSKRSDGDEKEKTLPIAYLGSTMVSHGDDFEQDSEFGQCLTSLGRANERIARMQENYVSSATSTWLESLERSLAQMKEYQSARKKLESRRLAFDTSQAKMNKSKKDDFRMEDELRQQKAKYEESSEDVYRRMLDIKEAEADSVVDLSAFVEAELIYYDRAREILLQLKKDWPAVTASTPGGARRPDRSRANSTTAFRTVEEESVLEDLRPPIRSRVSSAHTSQQNSPRRELPGFDWTSKPSLSRTTTFEGPQSLSRERSPGNRLSRVPTDTLVINTRSQLRPTKRDTSPNVFADDTDDYDRADSPARSNGSGSRSASWAADMPNSRGKIPPPPPPSRSKKPPPPPPLKRSALSTSAVPIL